MTDEPVPVTKTYAELRAEINEMNRLINALDLDEPLPAWMKDFLLCGSTFGPYSSYLAGRRASKAYWAKVTTDAAVKAGVHVHVAEIGRSVCYWTPTCRGCEPPG